MGARRLLVSDPLDRLCGRCLTLGAGVSDVRENAGLHPRCPGSRRTGVMPEVAHRCSRSAITARAVASSDVVMSRTTRPGLLTCCSSICFMYCPTWPGRVRFAGGVGRTRTSEPRAPRQAAPQGFPHRCGVPGAHHRAAAPLQDAFTDAADQAHATLSRCAPRPCAITDRSPTRTTAIPGQRDRGKGCNGGQGKTGAWTSTNSSTAPCTSMTSTTS